MPHHNPQWKVLGANWRAFQQALAQCIRFNDFSLTDNVDVFEARLVNAIDGAAPQTISKTRPRSWTIKAPGTAMRLGLSNIESTYAGNIFADRVLHSP